MQMEAIDLLNKIVKREKVPKRIRFLSQKYIWYDNIYTGNKGYCKEPLKADANSFLEIDMRDLTKEIEIIEEEKGIPERLNVSKDEEGRIDDVFMSRTELAMRVKINEIIDYLESKEDE